MPFFNLIRNLKLRFGCSRAVAGHQKGSNIARRSVSKNIDTAEDEPRKPDGRQGDTLEAGNPRAEKKKGDGCLQVGNIMSTGHDDHFIHRISANKWVYSAKSISFKSSPNSNNTLEAL